MNASSFFAIRFVWPIFDNRDAICGSASSLDVATFVTPQGARARLLSLYRFHDYYDHEVAVEVVDLSTGRVHREATYGFRKPEPAPVPVVDDGEIPF